MAEVNNPHDAFFKQFLAKPEIAIDFLRNHLPSDVEDCLELSALAAQKDSFIDTELQEHLSDLLYRIPLKAGQNAHVYLLFEHKSYSDRWVTFQLLRYMVRIWEKERNETGLISPIIPLVVYHGRVKWNFSTRFTGLFENLQPDTLNSLRHYLPEFHYQLTDLSPFSDTEIQGEIWSRIFQLILRYIFDDELGQRLPGILGLAGELAQQGSGLEMLVTILRYVSRAGRGATREDIRRAVMAIIPNDGGVLMKTAAEEWIEEGITKGFQQGIEQGIEQGLERGVQAQRTTLGLFLQRRFNPTEQALVALNHQLSQIRDLDQLTQLFNHALDAVDLADFAQRLTLYLPAIDQQVP